MWMRSGLTTPVWKEFVGGCASWTTLPDQQPTSNACGARAAGLFDPAHQIDGLGIHQWQFAAQVTEPGTAW